MTKFANSGLKNTQKVSLLAMKMISAGQKEAPKKPPMGGRQFLKAKTRF